MKTREISEVKSKHFSLKGLCVKHGRLSEFFKAMDFANFPAKTSVFTRHNYCVWAVKMETYLKAFDLWEILESNKQQTPLRNNPTIAQRFKALTCLYNAVSEEIFTIIMACKSAKKNVG